MMRFFLAAAVLSAACVVDTDTYDSQTLGIVDGTRDAGRPEVIFLYNIRGSACTGTIIAPRVVLTAKHCIDAGGGRAAPASNFRVLVGATSGSFSNQYFVDSVHPAPGRWDLRDGSDVALLILSGTASETPRPVSWGDPRTLREFTAVGYGQTPSGGSGVKYSVADKRVDGVMGNFIYVRPSVCSGDSGGPIIGPDDGVWGVASFIYSETGGEPRCGSAPGAYNSLISFRSFIEGIIEESGACVPREEVCNNTDDNCDGEVDEGCTAIGEGCLENNECVGETCAQVVEGAGKICTLPCDPLRPDIGCPMGMYCSNSGGCDGLCAPGGRGELLLDEECSADTDCYTLRCTDPGDGVQRCLPACRGDSGQCLAGEVCAAGAGACGACVPANRIPRNRGIGEPCEVADECASGFCFEDESVLYCSRPCEDDEACGTGFHCRTDVDGVGSCVRGPREDVGGGCVDNDDCGSGICATLDGRRWCTAFCEDEGGCPDGFICSATPSGSVCAPELNLVGEDCAANEECASGLCAMGTPVGDVCTRLCGPEQACSPGFECLRIDGGRNAICVPSASSSGGGGGGCSTSGAGAGGFVIALMIPFFARRRRAA